MEADGLYYIYVAKTKALICFTYAKSMFSHDADHSSVNIYVRRATVLAGLLLSRVCSGINMVHSNNSVHFDFQTHPNPIPLSINLARKCLATYTKVLLYTP